MTRGGGFTLSKLLYIASLEESLLEMSSNCFKKFEGCMVMCFTYTLWKCRMVLSDYFQFTRSFFSTHWSFYAYANCLTNTWLLFSITILGTFINPPCWCLWGLFEYLALVINSKTLQMSWWTIRLAHAHYTTFSKWSYGCT